MKCSLNLPSIKTFKILVLTVFTISSCYLSKTNTNKITNVGDNADSNTSSCSISSISIPLGTTLPVIVYRARKDNNDVILTVLEKEHMESLQTDQNLHLVYTDKRTSECWYSSKEMEDEAQESMRDIFSMCRTLNSDNKAMRLYQDHKTYARFESQALPENVSFRVSVSVDDEVNRKNNLRDNKLLNENEKATSGDVKTANNNTSVIASVNGNKIDKNMDDSNIEILSVDPSSKLKKSDSFLQPKDNETKEIQNIAANETKSNETT